MLSKFRKFVVFIRNSKNVALLSLDMLYSLFLDMWYSLFLGCSVFILSQCFVTPVL